MHALKPSCAACGTQLGATARFCSECGAPATHGAPSAEYKQVTVLFADVVHSMDLAAAVGAERLRDIMADLVDAASAVVKRYGGTVDKFTGDGLMALFGAPAALEDHAVRACMAALGIQDAVQRLAVDIRTRDGVDLRLRVGLNSGEVVVGDIGSAAVGYTAIGEQVGLAQRMESVAPPDGVMLSSSTARLVVGNADLVAPESVQIKGIDTPVAARRLIGMRHDLSVAPAVSDLVGRRREMGALEASLTDAINGAGTVLGVVGPPGIGKSRLTRELSATASARGVRVFTVFCESHTSQVPFHALTRLLRAATGVEGREARTARTLLGDRFPDADSDDLLLLADLLGIADSGAVTPRIDPDARRRRLTALVRAALMAREAPALYIIEDVHWIDHVSESMLTEFLAVVAQTTSLVIVTYRPEYSGALLQAAEIMALEPLSDAEAAALVAQLLGPDPSVADVCRMILDKAAGIPFFAEEIVRDLAERGLLRGGVGAYRSSVSVGEVNVPPTLQAVIGARIDRLEPTAKRALAAAAVVGSRFSADLLARLDIQPDVHDLITAQFIDRVEVAGQPRYVFHHPLIRAVAYESQLKSDRAHMHRRVAAALQQLESDSADENAALIAEHLEAAGDARSAYDWHMRAAGWARARDVTAARLSWERARSIADELSPDVVNRASLRVAPRTMLCATAYRVRAHDAGARFAELRQLCSAAGDKPSLAIAMAGLVMDHAYQGRIRRASRLASEAMNLIESLGDATLTVGLSFPSIYAKIESGEYPDVLRWSQRMIDLADGDPFRGNFIFGSPLALAYASRAMARYCLGRRDWRSDLRHGVAMAHSADPLTYAAVVAWGYFPGIANGVMSADDRALREIEDALRIAERSGNDMALAFARLPLGIALVHRGTVAERDRGQVLLAEVRDALSSRRHNLGDRPLVEVYLAREWARREDGDEALPLMRAAVDQLAREGQLAAWGTPATGVLVETLLGRAADGDLAEAEAAIDRLAAVPAAGELVLRDIWLLKLRMLLAQAHGQQDRYVDCRDRYRARAAELDYEGHRTWAAGMP